MHAWQTLQWMLSITLAKNIHVRLDRNLKMSWFLVKFQFIRISNNGLLWRIWIRGFQRIKLYSSLEICLKYVACNPVKTIYLRQLFHVLLLNGNQVMASENFVMKECVKERGGWKMLFWCASISWIHNCTCNINIIHHDSVVISGALVLFSTNANTNTMQCKWKWKWLMQIKV